MCVYISYCASYVVNVACVGQVLFLSRYSGLRSKTICLKAIVNTVIKIVFKHKVCLNFSLLCFYS